MSSSDFPAIVAPKKAFYGVQLQETAFRHWEFTNDNESRLIYHFENIEPTFRRSLQNILISVTKAYPDADESEIKKIAATIRQAEKITVFDPVFGLESQSIRRFGFVNNKNIDDKAIILDIEWVDEQDLGFGFVSGNIFKEDAELQMLTSREFRIIEKQYGEELQLAYRQKPGLLRYDQSDYQRISEPEFYQTRGILEKEQHALREAKIDQGGTVRLLLHQR